MSSDEFAFMTAVDMAAAVRSKEVSPVEVTRAILERIDRLNPRLNAYLTVCHDEALAEAASAEQAVARGDDLGPLHGVPVSIKDLTRTRDIRTTGGSLVYKDFLPDEDAVTVERLRRAGAIVVGKTNTPEFGLIGTTENRLGDPCRNPWDTDRTTGGSSGGAGAAIAAGLGPIALGSDGGGSVRIPSGFCGLFGIKPTIGRVPHHGGIVPGWPTLALSGPMARTVEDGALMLDVIAGPDACDPFSLPAPGMSFRESLDGGVSSLRVAWTPDLGFAAVEPEVRRITADAAHRFADLGCDVEEAAPELDDEAVMNIFVPIAFADEAAGIGQIYDEQTDLLCDYTRLTVEMGRRITGVQYVEAMGKRFELWARVRDFFHAYDLLLLPTLACPAFPHYQWPTVIDGREVRPFAWMPFTMPFNLTGQPAASVPCGWTDEGLPVGLQIVGRPFDEVTVLRAAAAFEAVWPWQDRKPDLAG
jgi:aspartyl-tRNA(Asn)/glutamyl-tRNA(Gln) amidotransferase subunit A